MQVDHDLVFQIHLDRTLSYTASLKGSNISAEGSSWTVKGVEVGNGHKWFLKKFKFADLVTGKLGPVTVTFLINHIFIDDIENKLVPAEMKTKYASLGLIRVEVWRYRMDWVKSKGRVPFYSRARKMRQSQRKHRRDKRYR
jgi:hypothetical protein